MSVRRVEAGEPLLGLEPVGCPVCGRAFLGPVGPCPLCGEGALEPRPVVVGEGEPERVVPFSDGPDLEVLRAFAGIRFRTSDLTAENLASRARRVWWPVWLVDATCEGTFEAEVGFDEQRRSTEEVYDDGQWRSREVVRDKVRWAPRLGTVRRRYHNVPVAALSDHARRCAAVGDYALDGVPFDPSLLGDAWLQLPDITPDEAWPDAEVGLAHRVGEEVKAAIDVRHLRGVTVQATYGDRVCTWLLWPMYASWYVDDAGVRRAVWMHARTGRADGKRVASVRKGMAWAGAIGSLGLTILAASGVCAVAGIVVWPFLVVAAILAGIALVVCAFACWPPLAAWTHNRRELA